MWTWTLLLCQVVVKFDNTYWGSWVYATYILNKNKMLAKFKCSCLKGYSCCIQLSSTNDFLSSKYDFSFVTNISFLEIIASIQTKTNNRCMNSKIMRVAVFCVWNLMCHQVSKARLSRNTRNIQNLLVYFIYTIWARRIYKYHVRPHC